MSNKGLITVGLSNMNRGPESPVNGFGVTVSMINIYFSMVLEVSQHLLQYEFVVHGDDN